MKKNLMALAVAGTLVAPALAFAQASTVSIYGAMDASYERVQIDGGTASPSGPSNQYASRGRIASNSSLIGFRGSENLGGGLKAIFQVENQLSIDGVGGNNTQTMANGWNVRDTFVGLEGGFGQLQVGYLNPPRRALAATYGLVPGATGDAGALNWFGRVNIGAAFRPLNVATNTTSNTFGTAATGVGNLVSTIARSQGVSYKTPTFNGFQAHIHVTPNESRDNAPVGTGLAKRDPNLWNLGLNYAQGPASLRVSYAKLNDWTVQSASAASLTALGLSGKEDTKQLLVGGAYIFGGTTTVAFIYDRTELSLGQSGLFAALGDLDVRRNAWTLRARHTMGPHEIHGGYTRVGDNSVSGRTLSPNQTFGESGTNVYTLRYGYNFSKRTQLYAVYVDVRNKANANFEISAISPVLGSGTGGGAGVINAGADPRVIGVGLRHTF
jgi:predicted porin